MMNGPAIPAPNEKRVIMPTRTVVDQIATPVRMGARGAVHAALRIHAHARPTRNGHDV